MLHLGFPHSVNRFGILVFCISVCLFSASCSHQSKSVGIAAQVVSENPTMVSTIKMLQDSTSTLEQVQEAFIPVLEQLWEDSGDLNDLDKRLSAQKKSLILTQAVAEWFDRQLSIGNNVTAKSINKILDPLTAIGSQWFCNPDGEYPYIWRELYYVSNRESEDPIDGYFKIMIVLPCEKDPSPSAHIFFPMMAAGAPRLYFSVYSDPAIAEEDYSLQEIVDIEDSDWKQRHDDLPMTVFGGKEIVEKMLQYDVMYLAFRSSPTKSGGPGETEIAMMPLRSFQQSYDAVLNDPNLFE